MENFVVDVEDGGRWNELGGVPVVVGWENGGLKGAVYSEDVSFGRLIR